MTDEQIRTATSSEFATDLNKTLTYDCRNGRFPYYIYPSSFGPPSHVRVGGLAFSDLVIDTRDFTNASGHTESYAVLRFGHIQTGANIQVEWA